MTIIVCIDDYGGMLFNRRRVSSDRAVIADILEYADGRPLWLRAYSQKLFPDNSSLRVCDTELTDAGPEELVFLEEAPRDELLKKAARIVVYYWNRHYPSDVKFPIAQLQSVGKLESTVEFAGYSHSKITREVYAL